MALWTAAEAAAATGGKTSGDWTVDGVSIDTRTLETGDLFVALKAARDGHEFVAQALEKGAGAALVSRVPDDVPMGAPLLIVDDVLAGLEALGKAARARTQARIVAVTGSVGKTSTKEMLKSVLEPQGRTHASVASYNNHWGVPLTLARMPADTEFGIFELGMNAPGEIAPLSKQVRPHVAMITTVAEAHLEAFGHIEGIAAEKASIVEGLETGGVAVLPADVPTAPILVEAARQHAKTLIGFGKKADAFALVDAQIQGDATLVQARMRGAPILFRINSPGVHFASNALGALAVVEALGGDPGRAAVDMARWSPPKGRGIGEVITLDPMIEDAKLLLIDDAYNANPTSMAASFATVAQLQPGPKGRRIAFLGDMLELGDAAEALHRQLASDENLRNFDVVYCAGPMMKAMSEALPRAVETQWHAAAQDIAERVKDLVQPGDVALAKGSNGSAMWKVVDALRQLGHP